MSDNLFFIDENIPWENFMPGVQRKILGYDKNLMMVRVKFEKESDVPFHNHENVQSSLVESGKFEVTIGKTAMILGPGDGFFVPAGIEHKVYAIDKGVIIDTFYPAREDFLKK